MTGIPLNWISYALFASFSAALMAQANHHLQMRGTLLVLLRSVFTVLLLAPVVALVSWPGHTSFYVYFFLGALSAFVGDVLLFDAARKFGGRLTSMFMPVTIISSFLLWCAIDRLYLTQLLDTPLTSFGIIGCLLLAVYGIASLRNCDVSWPAFKQVFFVGLSYSLIDIFVKLGMEGTNFQQTAILFAFIKAAASLPFAWLAIRFKREAGLGALQNWGEIVAGKRRFFLMVGLIVGAISVANSYALNMAVGLSPNPGYVGVLVLLSIVWLSLYNRLRGFDDRASVKNIAMLAVSAAGLILLTR